MCRNVSLDIPFAYLHVAHQRVSLPSATYRAVEVLTQLCEKALLTLSLLFMEQSNKVRAICSLEFIWVQSLLPLTLWCNLTVE